MRRRALLAAGTATATAAGLGLAARAETAPLRVALISPNTGVLAAFGATNLYVQDLFAERLAAGLDTQHLGRRAVRLELYDAASSSEKAAQHAAALEFFAAARQVGYRPRMASIAKAFPFPDTVAQISQPDIALTNEVWWSPAWPFRSGLSGATSEQVAREYEQRTGRPWVQTLGFSHALVDLAAQTIQQARAPTRQALMEALRRITAKTVVGPLSFTGRMPSLNVCSTPAVGGQWLRDAGGRWVLQVVDNTRSPFIPVTASFRVGGS